MVDEWAAFRTAPPSGATPPSPGAAADPWADFRVGPPNDASIPGPGRGGFSAAPGVTPAQPAPPRGVIGTITDAIPSPGRAFNNYVIDPVIEAITGRKEAQELQAANPGAPLAGGAPAGQRAYASFMNTPDAMNRYLTGTFGEEGKGWYKLTDKFGKPTERVVVRTPEGERIFNPPGIDRGDIASMAGGVPDFVGGVAGGIASIPAYVFGPGIGIPASGIASSVGSQLVGETVGRAFPENRAAEPNVLGQVVPRAAKEGVMDALVGIIMVYVS
jgi:hypothetical protein